MKKIVFGLFLLALILLYLVNVNKFNNQAPVERVNISASSSRVKVSRITINHTPTPSLAPAPNQKTLPGGYQVFQTFNNCGPASLSMMLSHFEIRVSQEELGKQLRPYQNPKGDNDDKSVTLDELALAANKYGLVTFHRPAGNMEIVKQFIANDIPVVVRTWLHKGEDIGHYRVIIGYDGNTIIQDDSMQGAKVAFSEKDFLDLWQAFNYEFMVAVPKESQEKAIQILGELNEEKTAWEKALEFSQEEISHNPNDLYAKFNRSVALYHINRFKESANEYESIADKLPFRMLWYQLEPILALVQSDQKIKAKQISQNILDHNNRAYSELYYLLGYFDKRDGKLAEAEAKFKLADFYNSTGSWKVNIPKALQ
jgi:tetratricopeptide (TPR) repeat protein